MKEHTDRFEPDVTPLIGQYRDLVQSAASVLIQPN